jgi:hypothetical protein
VEFIKDPGPPSVHELTLADHQRIDIAKELAGHHGNVQGRIVWDIAHDPDDAIGTHTKGFNYWIMRDGSVNCGSGYEAVIHHGIITGFRKEWT